MENKKHNFNKIIDHIYQFEDGRRVLEERDLSGMIYFSGDIINMEVKNEDLHITVKGSRWNQRRPDYSTEATTSYIFTYKDTHLLDYYVIEEIKAPGECKYSSNLFEFYIYKRDRMFNIYI